MEKTPLKSLLVEDVDDDAQLLVRALQRSGYEPQFTRVDNEEDLRSALNESWQIVFSDFTMPSFDGLSALKVVREVDPDLPFIFVSGTIGEERAVEAVRSGAQDYILKNNLKRLSAAVPRELRESKARRKQRLAEEKIYFLANYDELTGLSNRGRFLHQLTEAISNTTVMGGLVAIVQLNLDRFRNINNTLGPASGDQVLKQVASQLNSITRPGDTLARLSGDEFAFVLPSLKSKKDVISTINTIKNALAQSVYVSGYHLHIHSSIGISVYPFDGTVAEELQRNAAIAMHKVKQDGGKGYQYFTDSLREQLHLRINLERELETAISTESLTMHYQPQIELSTGRVKALEALTRWYHKDFGAISPATFIPIAEESGLILSMSDWVISHVAQQIKDWTNSGLDDPSLLPKVAINFSAFQFRDPKIVGNLQEVMDESSLKPENIELEITETALMQDPETAQRILFDLKDEGFTISLDDFGTGYSSLSYLKRFPVDILKIDKSFINDVSINEDDRAITRAIIAIADRLKIQVVAEGVETENQLQFLYEEGCDLVQGYYLQPPIPADDITNLLNDMSPFTCRIPWLR